MASKAITELLRDWGDGNKGAGDLVFAAVYEELRQMAHQYFRAEGPGHTLQPTALVHELYLKLSRQPMDFQDRRHFFAIAARQVRHLLIDHARAAKADKRGGPLADLELPRELSMQGGACFDVLALDEAIAELEKLDPRVAQVVELRYFVGLTEAEAAEALNISVATLKRDWQFAYAWLRARLEG